MKTKPKVVKKQSNLKGIFSFFCGLFSIFSLGLIPLPTILAIIGIVLAVIQRKEHKEGFSSWGLALSIIGLILSIFVVVLMILVFIVGGVLSTLLGILASFVPFLGIILSLF